VIYFILYLLFEVLISVEVASLIGGLNTFLEIIVSALLGILLLKNFGATVLFNLSEFMGGGMSLTTFKNRNLFPFIGAILLIIPGFLSDLIGLLLQLNFITDFISENEDEKKKFNQNMRENEHDNGRTQIRRDDNSDFIDINSLR